MSDINEKNVSVDEEIMSKSDSRFEELLRDRADVQIPDSLMPENIYKLLDAAEEKAPEKKKSYKFVYITVIAAAAVLFVAMGLYLLSELTLRNTKMSTLGYEKTDSVEMAAGADAADEESYDEEMVAGDVEAARDEAADDAEAAGDDAVGAEESGMYGQADDSFNIAAGGMDNATGGGREAAKSEMKDVKTVIDDDKYEYTYLINTDKGLIEIHKKGIPEEKGLLSTIRVMVYNQGEVFSVEERSSKGKIYIDIITHSEGEKSEKVETYDITDPKSPIFTE